MSDYLFTGERLMDMAKLLEEVAVQALSRDVAGVHVETVTADSRRVRPGTLFVAVRGAAADGHQFIPQALAAGAVAVCGETPVSDMPVPYVQVADSRRAIARLAEAVHGHPARALRLVGVTGTNGKTSTATLVQRLCNGGGLPAGLVSTVYYDVGQGRQPALNTTPGPEELSALLAAARDNALSVVSLEVSSHALDQQRVSALEFDVAVFTNCTQDHLDYHGDMEQYFAAKQLLFESLGRNARKRNPKRAVVNVDDPYGPRLLDVLATPVWTYSLHQSEADFVASAIELGPTGTTARLKTPAGEADLHLKLLGAHNVANALAALAAAHALGVPLETGIRELADAPCVAGRCEIVDAGQAFTVIVDYAHTPDGLRALLDACRALKPRRIIVVFGCGGDRDRTKRPRMGELAAMLADAIVVTSDNPRTEDPLAIMLDIEVGLQHAGKRRGDDYVMEPDRRAAIGHALKLAEPGDMVVIAGKGHEDYQIVGTQRHHFDDREVARELLAEIAGGARC